MLCFDVSVVTRVAGWIEIEIVALLLQQGQFILLINQNSVVLPTFY